MLAKILSLKDKEIWSDYIKRLPVDQQDIYYTPEYYSLYENCGDGEALCFVYEEGDSIVLYPFLKNSINELGYNLDKEYFDIQGAYGYNGIVTSCNDEHFINSFHTEFSRFCVDNSIVAEFTRFHPLLNNHRFAAPTMKIFHDRNTVFLDLYQSNDDIWTKQFNTTNRNKIRKSQKNGVNIVKSNDYEQFVLLYNRTMEDLNAGEFFFFPQSYYTDFCNLFKSDVELYLAIYNGEAIAGAMFVFSQSYAHYHLSGRNRQFSNLAANNLILYNAIKDAKERGCKTFHFGGGTTSNDKDSLLVFKENFSKGMSEFWIGKRVFNDKIYSEVLKQWNSSYPDLYEKNRVKLLGYRDIKTSSNNL